jgi:DNA-binding response OmpR family regulator
MAEKALVVEDDRAALRPVSLTLGSAGHHDVPAVNGADGLRKGRREAAELVVDAMLPGTGGFEVCQGLPSTPAVPEGRQPVVALRPESQEAAQGMGEGVGADLHLPTPGRWGEATAAAGGPLSRHEDCDA